MDKKKISLKEIGLPRLLLLLFAGILLIVLSVSDFSGSNKKNSQPEVTTIGTEIKKRTGEPAESEYEKRLKEVLAKVAGVGSVEVMITEKESKELVVLKDKPYEQETLNEADAGGGSRISGSTKNEEETVLTGGSAGSEPFITKEIAAQIEGVLIIAEGGSDGRVAADITAAVQALFDVPAHKIKVLPME